MVYWTLRARWVGSYQTFIKKSPWAKWALKIASLSVHTPLLGHTFLPQKKTTFGRMFPSLLIPYCGAHIFAKKKHHFGGFHSLHHTPYWCTHSWQNNHHFSSLGSSHEGVLQMALAIHLLHFPTFLNLILSGVSSSQGWNILVLLLLQSRSWSPNHHQRSLGGRG